MKLIAKNSAGKIGRSKERGLALVEFAICVPVVLFVTWCTIEFGNALLQYNTLTKGVRDGARYLIRQGGGTGIVNLTTLDPDTLQNVVVATQNLVVYGARLPGANAPILPGLAPANVNVTLQPNGTDISVVATYNYSPMFLGGIPQFIPHTLQQITVLEAGVIMRVLK